MRRIVLGLMTAIVTALAFTTAAAAYTGQNVTGTVSFNAAFNETVTANVPVPYLIPEGLKWTNRYNNGTGSNAVDTWYIATLTLAGTPTTVDLTNVLDPSNTTVSFARVREFIVQNTAITAGYDVNVYKGASNGWAVLPASSSPVPCRYGAAIYISDPISTGSGNGNIVSGTSKTITLDPGANTVTVYVMAAGGSAQ